MSKTKKNQQKGFSTLNLILVIQLIVIFALSIFITMAVSRATMNNTIDHLGAISDERAQIVRSYVKNCENTLKGFAKGKEVRDLLEYSKKIKMGELGQLQDPGPDAGAKRAQRASQEYCIRYGKDIDNLEGLWVGSWETFILNHNQ